MDIKIKTLYKDRVKPTDLLEFHETDGQDGKVFVQKQLEKMIQEIVEKILDEEDTMVGLYISRE